MNNNKVTEEIDELDSYFVDFPPSDDVNKDDLEIIRNWINTEPHLPYLSDRQISIFLHSCHGTLEWTKNTIDNYYTVRTLTLELFPSRNVDALVESLKIVYIFKLTEQSVDKYNVFFGGLNDPYPEKIVILEAFRLAFTVTDTYMNWEPYASGWRIAINASGFTFGHFVKLTTSMTIIKKVICYLQDALPIRLKGIHIFSAIPLVTQFVALINLL